MNQHSLKVLEFQKIVDMLVSKCQTELGAKKATETYPKTNLELIKIMLNQTSEVKAILDTEGSLPFRQIYDIRNALEIAKVGSTLNEIDLVRISTSLRSITGLFNFILNYRSSGEDKQFSIAKLVSNVADFSGVTSQIDKCINYDGKVLDSASLNLNKIRNDIKVLDSRIKEKINQIAASPKNRTYLSDPIVTIRSDRYCVPVKSEYKNMVPGIVHDSSGSGSTLYVEPGIIVDIGNKLKEAYGKEREEVQKILESLSKQVGEYSSDALYALDLSAQLDVIYAKAILAFDLRCSEPRLNDRGRINLKQAKHPLLSGDIVPIDVNLGYKFDCLLITGPNTGGKTVTLKTVGLLCVMAMCGMFIPCEDDSEISVFKDIFADIGDEQSIEQSLSTFSGHIKNIIEITENATSHSLVLVDELGAGTDPSEGSALAQGIIEYLMEKKAKVIATTHYGELKHFAFVTDGIENASVEFDTTTLRATYKLLIGVPGSSNAFHIAGRMGISEDILNKAKAAHVKEISESDEIIQKIEEIHKDAAVDRIDAAKRLKEIENIKIEYNKKLSEIEYQQSIIEDKIRRRANKIIREYSETIAKTIEELKNTDNENQERQSLKKNLNELIDDFEFKIKKPLNEPKPKEYEPVGKLEIGDNVFVKSLETIGSVVEFKGKNVMIMVNSMRMTMSLDNLAKAPEVKKVAEKMSHVNMSLNKAKDFRPEIKLIGMRAEEAIFELDKYIDNATAANANNFRIVHGKGTGALRSAVHLYLKGHPLVKSYKLADHDEGGDGATKVILKD